MNNIKITNENYDAYQSLLKIKREDYHCEDGFVSKKDLLMHDIILLFGLLGSFLLPSVICGSLIASLDSVVEVLAILATGFISITSICFISSTLDKKIDKLVKESFNKMYPNIDFNINRQELEKVLEKYDEDLEYYKKTGNDFQKIIMTESKVLNNSEDFIVEDNNMLEEEKDKPKVKTIGRR